MIYRIYRTVLSLGAASFFTFLFGSLSIIGALLTFGHDSIMIFPRLWSKAILRTTGVKVVVKGAEKLNREELVLFMSNHKSSLDIVSLFLAISFPMRMISKRFYFYIPFMGLGMWLLDFPFVDRGNTQKAIKSLKRAAKMIREKKRHILIFPEGTRSRDGNLQPFKKGPFHTAAEVNIPVVPVVVMESDKLCKPASLTIYPGTVYVYFGDPIGSEGCETKEGREALAQKVKEAMERLIDIHTETVEPQR